MPQTSCEDMMHRYRYFYNLMRRRHHLAHDKIGVRHGRGKVLSVLREQNGIGQKDLAEILQIRPASASELLGKMEKMGWITRKTNEYDKRKTNVFLTEKGEEVSQQMIDTRRGIAEEIFGALDTAEREQFGLLLDKLVQKLERQDLGR